MNDEPDLCCIDTIAPNRIPREDPNFFNRPIDRQFSYFATWPAKYYSSNENAQLRMFFLFDNARKYVLNNYGRDAIDKSKWSQWYRHWEPFRQKIDMSNLIEALYYTGEKQDDTLTFLRNI